VARESDYKLLLERKSQIEEEMQHLKAQLRAEKVCACWVAMNTIVSF
jgi:hypothetical protein